jgi:hypothetical protein
VQPQEGPAADGISESQQERPGVPLETWLTEKALSASLESIIRQRRYHLMGFLRKTTFLATGGMSGLVLKSNSKKERAAKAAEKQLRVQKQLVKQQKQLVAQQAKLGSLPASNGNGVLPVVLTNALPVSPAAGPTRSAATGRKKRPSVSSAELDKLNTREQRRQQRIEWGAWWLERGAFQQFSAPLVPVRYLGGWPEHPTAHAGGSRNSLRFDSKGIHYVGVMVTMFTVPWEAIRGLAVEEGWSSDKPEVASAIQRGAVTSGAVLIANTTEAGEVLFFADRIPCRELELALLPIVSRMNKAANRAPGELRVASKEDDRAPDVGNAAEVAHPAGTVASGAMFSVADELQKLALLRNDGLLTDEEFAEQKAKLLGR